MQAIRSACERFLKSEDGPTTVEYAVMVAFIISVCVVAISAIGINTNAIFEDARDMLT